jgi:hypothetical protein
MIARIHGRNFDIHSKCMEMIDELKNGTLLPATRGSQRAGDQEYAGSIQQAAHRLKWM